MACGGVVSRTVVCHASAFPLYLTALFARPARHPASAWPRPAGRDVWFVGLEISKGVRGNANIECLGSEELAFTREDQLPALVPLHPGDLLARQDSSIRFVHDRVQGGTIEVRLAIKLVGAG